VAYYPVEELAMSNLTRAERLQIMLTPEEVEAVDSWRFKRRMPSRAAAVRELLKRGLAADGFDVALVGQKSGDFGVTSAPSAPNASPSDTGAKDESGAGDGD
jgi:hypothetical protein